MDRPPTLTHVRLLVESYERCFRFYAEDLGFEPTFGDATSGYADFRTGSVSLALHDAGEMADALGAAGGERGRDGAALVLRVEDVDAAYGDLAAADCERVGPPQDRPDWGIRVAHVRDPDGSLIEVNEPLEG
jgi:catechol 2,3-dioxygenase-like lactoylglutathione lyase family enzyme